MKKKKKQITVNECYLLYDFLKDYKYHLVNVNKCTFSVNFQINRMYHLCTIIKLGSHFKNQIHQGKNWEKTVSQNILDT